MVVRAYNAAFDDLRWVYLEDSWVLDVRPDEGSVILEMDLVLTPEHPAYAPPLPGEQHCYRRGELIVTGVVSYVASGRPPATDETGEPDHGNIDSFSEGDDATWRAEGDWGALEANDPSVVVRLR